MTRHVRRSRARLAEQARHLDTYFEWLTLRNLRPATIAQRRYALGRLAHYAHETFHIRHKTLLELDAADVAGWWVSLGHLEAESRATELSHVRNFYAWAEAEGIIDANPTRRLQRPKLDQRLPRPVDDDKVAQAFETADPRLTAILALAGFAGLRCGEIARLRAEDLRLNGDSSTAVIRETKGRRDRAVPLAPEVVEALTAFGVPARGWLFPRGDGGPGHLPPHRISQIGNRHLHRVGIGETMHQFRHRFGTVMYDECRDLRLVQEVMGHASPKTTAAYTKLNPAEAAVAVRAAARLRVK